MRICQGQSVDVAVPAPKPLTAGWTGRRRGQLPTDWAAIRARIRVRAADRCEYVDVSGRCPSPGTDCHHTGRGDDHREQSLQWLCADHHAEQTRRQAAAARATARAAARHPSEPHPGVRAG